ncbi:MAG: hypothetical protein L6R42_005570 [Xanthoria sp. 1 TBL-2021]|nr:MAG: hypothetical protein L6R42_005570 [Xanthoria sp. 1 TBL-2021]
MATLGCALPQAPPATGVDPALIPNGLPVSPGTPENFLLLEDHIDSESNKNYWTSCWNRDLTPKADGPTFDPAWAGNMQTCLNNYNIDSWDGATCGGSGWFKGPNGPYKEPLHCYHACAPCMEWFISKKSSGGICWSVHGAIRPNTGEHGPPAYQVNKQTSCHMGYGPM